MFAAPVSNLKQFGLREDMIVADLGAGSGFYSIPAGRIVSRGKVYAIEVQKDFIPTIQSKAKDARVNNIECLWGDIEKVGGTKIRDRIVDAVIASDVLFQVENREKFIEEIKRILGPGGKVMLIDWSDAFSGMGPNSKMLIPKNTAKSLFESKGFKVDRDINAGSHHYGMILEKS